MRDTSEGGLDDTVVLDPQRAQTGEEGGFLEDDYLPTPPRRAGRLTRILTAAVLVGLGVLGGVQLEKAVGGSGPTTVFISGDPSAAPPSGARPTASEGSLTGTVVSLVGNVVTVRDAAGVLHRVTLTSHTTITAPYRSNTPLLRGDAVTIRGTATATGTVTATSVLVTH